MVLWFVIPCRECKLDDLPWSELVPFAERLTDDEKVVTRRQGRHGDPLSACRRLAGFRAARSPRRYEAW